MSVCIHVQVNFDINLSYKLKPIFPIFFINSHIFVKKKITPKKSSPLSNFAFNVKPLCLTYCGFYAELVSN